jgi:D-alanyl-D-alanine carboxypeptidase/D-alanyl-D-alanine-endopeptidase (penicillin-binding protein 4)
MAPAGQFSGALVVDMTSGQTLFSKRAGIRRVPASNEKLFTTAVAMRRFGPDGTLRTRVIADGTLGLDGTFTGTLYLVGGGDPTFGSNAFVTRYYGAGGTVEQLANGIEAANITRLKGKVIGDESAWDTRRGGPSSGYAFDYYLGAPLSALSFDRGNGNGIGSKTEGRPAAFAAARLAAELRRRGIGVGGSGQGLKPPGLVREIAHTDSPPVRTLAAITNVPSDNFMAEMLLKAIGMHFGGAGTTAAGASAVRTELRKLGIRPAVVDGSGLSRADTTTPGYIVGLLRGMAADPAVAAPFRNSLAVAGRSGTLAGRMRGTAAAGRCVGKTGTLDGVSALSGYCRGAHDLAFSILMNGVNVSGARALQDRMGIAMARYAPSG